MADGEGALTRSHSLAVSVKFVRRVGFGVLSSVGLTFVVSRRLGVVFASWLCWGFGIQTNVVAWRRGTRFWVGKNPVNLRGISIVLLPGVETVDTDHLVTISERSSKQLCGIGFN